MSELKWSYGVTTVPSRQHGFLKLTLESLAKAGFPKPRLFVDGDMPFVGNKPLPDWPEYIGWEVTSRSPTIRPMGNWWLALWELFIREPHADRYAIFQDDILCCSNLREYLEREFPECGYLNLITFPTNLLGVASETPEGWFKALKRGKGGQGLVFDQAAVAALLMEMRVLRRLQDSVRGHRSLDGTVRDALYNAGFTEWVHNPSLLDHLGAKGKTSMPDGKPQPTIKSFLGEDYNPLAVLERSES